MIRIDSVDDEEDAFEEEEKVPFDKDNRFNASMKSSFNNRDVFD
jgi:hypothetical protein